MRKRAEQCRHCGKVRVLDKGGVCPCRRKEPQQVVQKTQDNAPAEAVEPTKAAGRGGRK